MADEMEDRTGEEELADAAIHFALMSYAAGRGQQPVCDAAAPAAGGPGGGSKRRPRQKQRTAKKEKEKD